MLKEMKMRFKNGTRKVLALSYDDGHVHDIRLIEIFNKYGLKGTFNISSGRYENEDVERECFSGPLKLSEAKKVYINSGHEIALHTFSHPHLNILDSMEVVREVVEDRKSIEKEFGVLARGMAYPYGVYNDEVKSVLESCHIAYARTAIKTYEFGFPDNWLELNPTCHHNYEKLMELIKEFVEVPQKWAMPQMFCMYGHSWEFHNNDNWDVIEKFAEYVGGRQEIWYATLIEIYDYVKAYKNLQTSYEKKIFHNPSAIDVWFEINETVYCVKAGKTLYI